MTILVIDSDMNARISLQNFFNGQGVSNLHVSESAADAWRFIEEHEQSKQAECINLIVISNTISDADHFELCRKIRASRSCESAYIQIVVSSSANKTDINKAKQSGANDYTVKPYDGEGFLKQFVAFSYGRRVLLVEDDPVVSRLISSLLCKKRAEVVHVPDGMLAYNLINTMVPPRVVLMDIGLPGMNGHKLIQHIRSKKLWKRTDLIMLTASTDLNDVKKSLLEGANDYIAKPFEVAMFMQRIEKYFPVQGRS